MKTTALRVALAAALFLGAACWLAVSIRVGSANKEMIAAQGAIDAKSLFEKNCAKCHGKDGRAKTFRGRVTGARNLTNEAWHGRVTDEQIKEAIKKGPDEMPSFEKKLSEAEIDALIAYVRHFKGTAPKK